MTSVQLVDSIPIIPHNAKKKWEPKQWRVEYDRVIAYSAAGHSNIEIAEKLGFTKEFVSVIINLPEGKRRYERLQNIVNNVIEDDIPTRLARIAKKAVERLENVMNDDDLFSKNPFGVIDRGMDVIKGLGHIRGGGNGAIGEVGVGGSNVSITNTTIITQGQKSELMDGLEKVAEVNRLQLIKKQR